MFKQITLFEIMRIVNERDGLLLDRDTVRDAKKMQDGDNRKAEPTPVNTYMGRLEKVMADLKVMKLLKNAFVIDPEDGIYEHGRRFMSEEMPGLFRKLQVSFHDSP